MRKHFTLLLSVLLLAACRQEPWTEDVRGLIGRVAGRNSDLTLVAIPQQDGKDCYEVHASEGHLTISASSPSAMSYAFGKYLRDGCSSMVTWSGSHLDIPERWPDYQYSGRSPFDFRYFLNVCTFGYTTPYWDWERWSEELDLMALHGVNMPLASVASEAIARRVWIRMGLSPAQADAFFTGPAHLPWHRMGNLIAWDGPLNGRWHKDQIALQHKILRKMRAFGMEPVAPAFAGFVPPAFMELFPEAPVHQLEWGGFPTGYNACVLSPDSPLFVKIGRLFVEEWEKEFGKAVYYLSDSFNEMKLPVAPSDTAGKHAILERYGQAVCSSILAGNPDAVWVTQGWTFGYQHDFWDKESLKALIRKVPDDKMIIIDLGNDYPKWVWGTEPTWEVHDAFHGKRWIYSYVPNFGGKTLPTGDLRMYASAGAEALHSSGSGRLAGFGSAPEGLENNEVVYELLADMGWTEEPIEIEDWLERYCRARYGNGNPRLAQAWRLLLDSVYGSLYSYPRFTWQTVVPDSLRISRHALGDDFHKAVRLLLDCRNECGSSALYRNDVIEFSALWLGTIADDIYHRALETREKGDLHSATVHLDSVVSLLGCADKLLASHPNHNLSGWLAYATNAGRSAGQKKAYESNARRIISTWGGANADYAARFWSGLISDYYIPRLKLWFSDKAGTLRDWEEDWINSGHKGPVRPFDDPLGMADKLIYDGLTGQAFSRTMQQRAAEDLIDRVTGGRAREFDVRITDDGSGDSFAYFAQDGRVILSGNNGVSIASALNAYLKDCCAWHYSWCGSTEDLPAVLPLPKKKVERSSPYGHRYFFNYCTFNYSMSWWDFDRWEKEIDFLAMNGINMPLALTGQNTVWQRVYRRLGFSDEDLESFFSGPAYFNWFWMGNLDGWGGPLPQSFIDKHEALQKRILHRERSLGMKPILPAFTGHVPPAMERKYPGVRLRKTSWVNFPPVSILDPEEELFSRIGRMYIEEQTALYGTDHYYTADTFNENTPPSGDSLYLSSISSKVYHSMSYADPDAVWVMQGWMFYHGRDFWKDDRIRALLSAVPDDKMLILDLWSERYPVWNRTDAYFGKPWIWCMLHNFGQNITLSGNASSIARDPAAALSDPASGRMAGIGLTPEGIGHTPVIYALMLENVWKDTPTDIDAFIRKYFTNRYGNCPDAVFEAWKLIFDTAFENTVNNGGHESVLTGRPTLKANPRGCTNTEKCYADADLIKAWSLLCSAMSDDCSDGFRYDVVDITRQVLADYASTVQQRFASDLERGNMEAFEMNAQAFLELIDDMDMLLSTRQEFLLGRWLEDAKAMGDTPREKALYEYNARNLITLWGDKDCRIYDYACRQWAGMMGGFYRKRWELFFDHIRQEGSFKASMFDTLIKDYEWDWVHACETYPTRPSGDEVEAVRRIMKKYSGVLGLP